MQNESYLIIISTITNCLGLYRVYTCAHTVNRIIEKCHGTVQGMFSLLVPIVCVGRKIGELKFLGKVQ